jgi:hypothetical protein
MGLRLMLVRANRRQVLIAEEVEVAILLGSPIL